MKTYNDILSSLNAIQFTNNKAVSISDCIRCHSRADKTHAARLLIKQHPSEDRAVFDWRMNNFVHITYPYFQKALNAVNRIFSTTGYSWLASESTTSYLKTNRFFNRLFFNQFITQYVMKFMIEDPNAWLVAIPKNIEKDAPDVDLLVIPSNRQLYVDDDVIAFTDNDCSTNSYLAKRSGWIIDRNNVVHYTVRGDRSLEYPVIDFNYIHNLGELPFIILGGEQSVEREQLSFFQSFCEFGDQALVFYSEWQVTKSSCTFPIKEMEPMTCPTCHGSRFGEDEKVCGTCHGSGEVVSFSPATILVREKRRLGEPESTRQKLEYISPPVDILQEQKADWQMMLDRALESINMHFVLEQQSGVAKEIDRTEFYSFLQKISTNLFDNVMHSALTFIEKYRRGSMAEEVVVQKPTTFTLLNENALYDDLKNSFETPFTPLRTEALRNYWRIMSNNDAVKQKVVKFMSEYDPLFCHTMPEATVYHDVYAISTEDIKKHIYAYAELTGLIREKDEEYSENPSAYFNKNWFLDSNYNEITNELNRRIALRIESEDDRVQEYPYNPNIGTVTDLSELTEPIRNNKPTKGKK